MQVPDNKEVANHVVPESCVAYREIRSEALTGVRIGQPLSRDSHQSRVLTLLTKRKAARRGALHASSQSTRRGRRPWPWHVRTLFAREPGDLLFDRRCQYRPRARIGKARSHSRW